MSQIATLTISALGHRGEGLARQGEDTIFVPLTLPGEQIRAEMSGNRGRLVEVMTPSPDRAEPFCPHFGQCGGCQLQHMTPNAYGAFKRALVEDALARAGVNVQIAETVIVHGAGRRRVTLHSQKDIAGFMGLRSHDIHGFDVCPILVPALSPATQIARELAAFLGSCDVSLTASDTGLDVAVTGKGLRPARDLAALAHRHDLARLAINGEVAYQVRAPMISMGKASVAIPVGSFLQATGEAEEAIAARVVAAAKGFKSVADLFCGMGPFALRLAKAAPVFAADSDQPAIAALKGATRKVQGLKPIAAERRDLFREPLTGFELNRFDCVVIDPPRAGAKAQVGELARSKVQRIIYVSCDPQSFARDAAVLIKGGYRMGKVTPVDQFAWSSHVELVAVFER